MPERVEQSEKLLVTTRFYVERIRYRTPAGSLVQREIIQHPGAVVIIPLLTDGRLCLIRNYRVAVGQHLIELPAGTLEPGEEPIETARRELVEETGFAAGEIRPLIQLWMSPGILNERMHVFLALNLIPGPRSLQEDEEIENLLVTREQVRELLFENAISDSKTVSALLYYLCFVAQ